jgi:serine/threonine-protein kinase
VQSRRPDNDVDLAEGTLVAGRFRLERELGRGAMGAVWLAQHTSLEVPCAVKFIHPELGSRTEDAEVRGRFEREARAIARLRSPHVVQVLDYGATDDGTPYLAMEYLVGDNLGERLGRVGRLSTRDTVHIVTQIARALSRAHAAGLVHRDLKPENVFLVGDEQDDFVKVLDFGIAKGGPAMPAFATRTGAVLGTPHFMSPEQAQGAKTLDHRSDLWSLGVLAFTCLTGQRPFRARVFGDLLLELVVAPLPVPSTLARDLPPAFDAWFAKACARDPGARFQTAKEQADALAECLAVSRTSWKMPAISQAQSTQLGRPAPTLPGCDTAPAASAVPETLPYPTRAPASCAESAAPKAASAAQLWWVIAPVSLLVGALVGLTAADGWSGSTVAKRSSGARPAVSTQPEQLR